MVNVKHLTVNGQQPTVTGFYLAVNGSQ